MAALFLAAGASAQESKFDDSYVQVWGHAEKEITPNEFYLSITINEKDSKGKVSVETQEKQMRELLGRVGVDVQRQLRIVDMSSEYFKKGNALAYKQYQLKLGDPAKVTQVFDALNGMGISNVTVEKVTHSELEAFKTAIRAEAIRNAQANAEGLASAIGQRAGRCFYIFDSNSDVMPTYGNVFLMRSAAKAVSADSVESAVEDALSFKTIKLKYNVQAKFVLE